MSLPDGYRLRPIVEGDLETVLAWRNSERIRSLMYTDHLIGIEEHSAWFERVKKHEPPLALILDLAGTPLGVVNITGLDPANGRCHWGFYIGALDAPRGSGRVMGCLALRYIFETLGVRKLVGEVLASNEGSIRYHRRLGFREEGRLVEHVRKDGLFVDVISFALFARDWQTLRSDLEQGSFQGREP